MPDDDALGRLKKVSEKATSEASRAVGKIASSAAKLAKESYERSGVSSKVSAASKTTKEFLDNTGVTDAATRLANATDDHLDTISGAKLLALVEEKLAIQSKYNDILATKLEEALDKIKRLEENGSRK
ncbi:MAG: hypothetical protein HY050_03140 [Actinobacteria bacterium]|nr:hypothetical protein [Actinomycetota bacterium]